jgi:hypothetical protein
LLLLLPPSNNSTRLEGRFVAAAAAVAVAKAVVVAVAAAVAQRFVAALRFLVMAYAVVKLRRYGLRRLYSVARNLAEWNKCSMIRTSFEWGSNEQMEKKG